MRRPLALGMLSPPTPFFRPLTTHDALPPSLPRLGVALPDNVDLLTLEVWSATAKTAASGPVVTRGVTLLVRLMHLFESGEHPSLSLPARVDLTQFLTLLGARPVRVRPRTLHAVRATAHESCSLGNSGGSVVWLQPLDICTYLVDF